MIINSSLLTGCNDGASVLSSTYLTGRGWARPPELYVPSPLYCYQTLGQAVCYKEPLNDGQKERMIEAYDTEVKILESETPVKPIVTPPLVSKSVSIQTYPPGMAAPLQNSMPIKPAPPPVEPGLQAPQPLYRVHP